MYCLACIHIYIINCRLTFFYRCFILIIFSVKLQSGTFVTFPFASVRLFCLFHNFCTVCLKETGCGLSYSHAIISLSETLNLSSP